MLARAVVRAQQVQEGEMPDESGEAEGGACRVEDLARCGAG